MSFLDFTGAKNEGSGGDNWSYKTCKVPVKSPPPTSQHPASYRPDALMCQQTNTARALKGTGTPVRKSRDCWNRTFYMLDVLPDPQPTAPRH